MSEEIQNGSAEEQNPIDAPSVEASEPVTEPVSAPEPEEESEPQN